MSGIWNRTLIYLGLREEPEEMYDDLPEQLPAEEDPDVRGAQRSTGRDVGGAERSSSVVTRSGAEARRSTGDGDTDGAAAAGSRGGERTRERSREDRSRSRGGSTEDTAGSNVRSLRTSGDTHVRPVPAAPLTRAAVIELLVFDDVEAVGARYRTGQPVVFDVSGADRAVARRMVDFVSGLTFALRGQLTKVGSGAFLLVPDGVELPADERRRLSDLGYRLPLASDV